MKTGVSFIREDGKLFHTYHEFGLLQLAQITLTPPQAKRHIITEVPGVDGNIDITDTMGPVRFENREMIMVFEGQEHSFDDWCHTCEKVYDAIHGRNCKIVLDIDPEYYYEGHITCESVKDAIALSEMTVTVDAYPYKRKTEVYHAEYDISGTRTITIEGDRMPVCPVIESNATMTVEMGNNTFTIVSGQNEADYELTEGTNELTFTGTGHVKIEWRGGTI